MPSSHDGKTIWKDINARMVCFGVVIESMGHHVDGGGNSWVLNCENISCGMLLISCIAVGVIRIWKHVAPAVPRTGFRATSQAQRRIRKLVTELRDPFSHLKEPIRMPSLSKHLTKGMIGVACRHYMGVIRIWKLDAAPRTRSTPDQERGGDLECCFACPTPD